MCVCGGGCERERCDGLSTILLVHPANVFSEVVLLRIYRDFCFVLADVCLILSPCDCQAGGAIQPSTEPRMRLREEGKF